MEKPTLHSLADAMNFTGKLICMGAIAFMVFARAAWCNYKAKHNDKRNKKTNKERIETCSKANKKEKAKDLGKSSSGAR